MGVAAFVVIPIRVSQLGSIMNDLTIVIPFRDGHATIDRLLDSLPQAIPVIVVDDLSEIPFSTKKTNVRVMRRTTRGYFAGAVNAGIEGASESDVLVLNQDVSWEGDAFFRLLAEKRDSFGVIGDGVFTHPAFPKGYVQGTAMFLRRDAIARVRQITGTLLNEVDYPLWGCTAEWQLRMCRAGFAALPVRASEFGMNHARGNAPYGSSIAETLLAQPDQQALFVRTPPAISVILTTFNYGRFLRDAVNSLIGGKTVLGNVPAQTFQSFEIILVDDGSTDDTPEIGTALADPWKGIRYIRREQTGGSSAAANTGIVESAGKLVTVLDGDDMMAPTRLERMYRVAVENPHSVIYDDLTEFALDRGTLLDAHPSHLELVKPLGDIFIAELPMPEYDFTKILTRNGMHKGILFPRAAWKEIGGYDESFRDGREDWAINVALGAKGYCGVHLKEPLYLRRMHGRNRHLSNSTAEWRQFHLEKMHGRYPNLYAGDRPMGCCGSKSNKSNGASLAAGLAARAATGGRLAMNELPGQKGFVRVEYLIGRAGTQNYIGAVTGVRYVFGGKRTFGYVDPRDLDALLLILEGRQKAFRVVASESPNAAASQKNTGHDGQQGALLPVGDGNPGLDASQESDGAVARLNEAGYGFASQTTTAPGANITDVTTNQGAPVATLDAPGKMANTAGAARGPRTSKAKTAKAGKTKKDQSTG